MANITTSTIENYKELEKILPSGPILYLSKFFDVIFLSTKWRNYLPFGLSSAPHGIFSFYVGDLTDYFPKLKVYNGEDVCDFLKTDSTILGDLTNPMTLLVLSMLVLCLCAVKAVLLPQFQNLGKKIATQSHGKEWVKQNEIRIQKFGEYCFRLLYHASIGVYGLYYFSSKEWWKNGTIYLWNDWPRQPIEPGMTFYYLIQAAYNVDALIYLARLSYCLKWKDGVPRLAWSETVRGDFREMAIHHIITNALVFSSSYLRLTRAGSVVFMIHDISDVPIDMSKLANFVKWKTTTAVCFALMVITWFITRLGILPFILFPSILYETPIMIDYGLNPIFYYAYRWPLFIMVAFMILLHCCWFKMMLKMGYVLVWTGETHDLSEHKSGEEYYKKKD